MRVAVLGLVLALVSSNVSAQRPIETGFLDRQIELDGQTYRYQVYVPPDYTPDQGWPVVMDLHSGGPLGTDGLRHTAQGLANYIRQDRTRFPIIAVFPQARPNTTRTRTTKAEHRRPMPIPKRSSGCWRSGGSRREAL